MSKPVAQTSATVTFALYAETPIACQGDDDQKKIQVISYNLIASDDIHEDALKRSVALGLKYGTYVQVWDVIFND